MSSERPGGPADVVPGDRDPRDDAEPGRRRARRARPAGRRVAPAAAQARREEGLAAARAAGAAAHRVRARAAWSRRSSCRRSSSRRARWSRRCTAAPGCTGDRVLVNKVPYWFGEPEPGDIVVFKGPDTWTPEVTVAEPDNWFTGALLWLGRTVGVAPPSEDDFVKRVIATEGQTVQCCDAEGRVTVDGEPLDEPYIFENTPIESRAVRPGDRARGPAVGDGRPPLGVGGLPAARERPVQRHDRRRRRHRQGGGDRVAGEPVRAAGFARHPGHRGGRRRRRLSARRDGSAVAPLAVGLRRRASRSSPWRRRAAPRAPTD